MKHTWFALLAILMIAPFQMGFTADKWKKAVTTLTNKEERKVVIGKECANADVLSKVEKNMNAIKKKLAAWGVAVEDQGKGYCGYNMISGKKMKRVDGTKSEDKLLSELTGFFSKKK